MKFLSKVSFVLSELLTDLEQICLICEFLPFHFFQLSPGLMFVVIFFND